MQTATFIVTWDIIPATKFIGPFDSEADARDYVKDHAEEFDDRMLALVQMPIMLDVERG